jgi:hypothetical protein
MLSQRSPRSPTWSIQVASICPDHYSPCVSAGMNSSGDASCDWQMPKSMITIMFVRPFQTKFMAFQSLYILF